MIPRRGTSPIDPFAQCLKGYEFYSQLTVLICDGHSKVVCSAIHWSSLQEIGDFNIFTNVKRLRPSLEWFQVEIS